MTPPREILVLGGTSWLGGEVAAQAVRRGHRVTCLARGRSGSAPEGVRWVQADRRREDAYDDVSGRSWDGVVDVSWQPAFVRAALAALNGSARHWTYVSSCSVYADDATPGQDESAVLHAPWTGTGEVGGEDYAGAKVACEAACRDAVAADRLLVARAGLIGGYGDRSDRLGYWPARAARVAEPGEPVLVPDAADQAVQVVDVVDLAGWLVSCVERAVAGTYNVTGDQVSLQQVLAWSAAVAGTVPDWRAASQDWLLEHEVQPWAGTESLPLWLPVPDYAGFMTRSNAAAKEAGLALRPVEDTIEDALRWERERGLDRDRSAGLSPEREAALLELLGR